MRRLLGPVLAACIPLVAGCDLAPEYKVPAVPKPVAFKEGGPWKAANPSDGIPRGSWWTAYGDGTLDTLEAQVDPSSPTLAAAVARYDQSRAYAAMAEAYLFPFIDLEGSSTRNRQSADRPLRSKNQPNRFGDNLIGAGATYELDLWGAVRNSVAAGEMSAQAQAADLESVRLSLHAELANDYVTLRGLDAQVKLLQDTVEGYDQALKLTQTRFEGKIASIIDVTRAQTQLSSARASVSNVLASRALYEHAIASLIGKPASDFSIPPALVDMKIVATPPGLPSTLLERRPDVAAAERRVAAANAEVGVARAAFYPNITLNLMGGFQNSLQSGFLAAPYSFWSVGPQFILPVFEGGLLEAQEAAAYGRLKETSEQYRATVLGAFAEVEDQLALLHHLEQESVEVDAAVTAAKATLDGSLNLYRDGAVNYLDVVEAQQAALVEERSQLDVKTRRLGASVRLIRALGGGWSTADLPSRDEVGVIDVSDRKD
ncbi:MAG: efflux transporter outer membrane subunit [Magnetospirillum sp.]|nr:efflux transporter outer membrane subunit [Magnetospirillum sp.]